MATREESVKAANELIDRAAREERPLLFVEGFKKLFDAYVEEKQEEIAGIKADIAKLKAAAPTP